MFFQCNFPLTSLPPSPLPLRTVWLHFYVQTNILLMSEFIKLNAWIYIQLYIKTFFQKIPYNWILERRASFITGVHLTVHGYGCIKGGDLEDYFSYAAKELNVLFFFFYSQNLTQKLNKCFFNLYINIKKKLQYMKQLLQF